MSDLHEPLAHLPERGPLEHKWLPEDLYRCCSCGESCNQPYSEDARKTCGEWFDEHTREDVDGCKFHSSPSQGALREAEDRGRLDEAKRIGSWFTPEMFRIPIAEMLNKRIQDLEKRVGRKQ